MGQNFRPSLRLQSPHTGVSRPPAPKPPNSLNKVFLGLPARSVKKVSRKSLNTDFETLSNIFWVLGDFRHFLDTPGQKACEDLLETLWGFRGSGVRRLLYMAVPIVMQSCIFDLLLTCLAPILQTSFDLLLTYVMLSGLWAPLTHLLLLQACTCTYTLLSCVSSHSLVNPFLTNE